MLNPGTYLQNRYEILERIGSGGMSVVYKAQCHTLNRLVAIKVLKEEFASDESFVSKFKMEAQSAASLSHPNIVSVYDVVNEGDLHYIVMELIEGITLKSYIEKKGHLENREAIGIAIQVGSGIAAAHEQHIIHRDIKPQNMIISREGKVKVADFGIARAVSTQTVNATAVGSVHYISPEQARGGYCDERSDIYSFGVTMYEMVTGRVPFEGDNTVAVALAHLEEPVVPPAEYNPEVSFGLEQIILKCTQKRPDSRYSSMNEVIADLRRVLVDPDCDIYEEEPEEEENLGDTRHISREELSNLQEARKSLRETEGGGLSGEKDAVEEREGEQMSLRRRPKKKPLPVKSRSGRRPEDGGDVSTQFERIITAIGIIAAVVVVIVVLFVFTRLTGLFKAGASQIRDTTAAAVENAAPEVEVTISDKQVYMPRVLGLPQDMAEAKLKESALVMHVAGEEYSENYPAGQVMAQATAEGTAVDKWSTVDVTVSKGSDRIDLQALNLLQMTREEAEALLKENFTVDVKEEFSDTAVKGKVIRFSPQIARVGETVELTVSSGPANITGKVPDLRGRDKAAADALLAAAGLTAGNISYETSETVPEGQIIRQSAEPGSMLAPQSAVDYVISGNSAQTQTAGEGEYYISSIDTTCSLSNYIGPASQTSSVRVMVRLKQTIDDKDVYTTLMSARLVVGAQDVPVVIPRIKGAYGVDSGTVEVVDADNLKVIASYPVTFFPVG